MRRDIQPTGRERTFGDDEIIVSKTDRAGKITYANDVFLSISGYTEAELLGAPHSILRHPDMPRTVFSVLWDTIEAGREIFAYVKNMTKSGDHYWVFAHVTPSFDARGDVSGFYSMRRTPDRRALPTIEGLYAELLQLEKSLPSPREQIAAGRAALTKKLEQIGLPYDELMFTL